MANIIDTKALGRPATFAGEEGEWDEWAFQMRSYLSCLHGEAITLITAAETENTSIRQANLRGDEERRVSVAIFHALTMSLKGPPAVSLRQIEFGNGLEAWRILRERYESSSRGRQYALLSRVLRPKSFPKEAAKFEESLGLWEMDIRAYETASTERLSENIMMQVLADQAPEAVRQQVQLANYARYAEMRRAIMEYVMATRTYATPSGSMDTSAPMDVGALTQPSKDQCRICGKSGHWAKDCWMKDKGKGKDKNTDQRQGLRQEGLWLR